MLLPESQTTVSQYTRLEGTGRGQLTEAKTSAPEEDVKKVVGATCSSWVDSVGGIKIINALTEKQIKSVDLYLLSYKPTSNGSR